MKHLHIHLHTSSCQHDGQRGSSGFRHQCRCTADCNHIKSHLISQTRWFTELQQTCVQNLPVERNFGWKVVIAVGAAAVHVWSVEVMHFCRGFVHSVTQTLFCLFYMNLDVTHPSNELNFITGFISVSSVCGQYIYKKSFFSISAVDWQLSMRAPFTESSTRVPVWISEWGRASAPQTRISVWSRDRPERSGKLQTGTDSRSVINY